MGGFFHGFATELCKLAADPQQQLRAIAPPKSPPASGSAAAPAPYQTPRTGVAGTPAPAPANNIGASSSYMRAMAPQAMQSPGGAARPDTYRPTQAFQQKAPPPAAAQPAQATPGGIPKGQAQPSNRWAFESGGNYLARRAGETLSNVMSPMTRGSGVAAKPTGTGPSTYQTQQKQQQFEQQKPFMQGAPGANMGRMM